MGEEAPSSHYAEALFTFNRLQVRGRVPRVLARHCRPCPALACLLYCAGLR